MFSPRNRKRLRAGLALALLLLFSLGSAVSRGPISVVADRATPTNQSNTFERNSMGIVTVYDTTLGERLSVVPIPYEFSRQGTGITGNVLKVFHGIDTDTATASSPTNTAQEGIYCMADGYLRNWYFHRVGIQGVSVIACTVKVKVIADNQESIRRSFEITGTDVRIAEPDSAFKVYEGERIAATVHAASGIEDPSLQFHFFFRDSIP